jgi:hypothetical protein
MVLPSTVRKISELGAITLLWFPDDPFLFYTLAREVAPAYDYVITSSEKCVRNILNDKKLLEEVGRNASSHAKENLCWEKAIQTLKFIQYC